MSERLGSHELIPILDDYADAVISAIHEAGGDVLKLIGDELGITEMSQARPLQAAMASAAAFGVGALPPVLLVMLLPLARVSLLVAGVSLALLLALGAVAARLGGAPLWRGAIRVGFWGAVAMGMTSLVGRLFGTAV